MPMNCVTSTKRVAGQSTLSTGPSCSRLTNCPARARRAAWAMMPRQDAIMIIASQNGKNPLFGPSVPQPTPSRRASKKTTPPSTNSTDAVRMSAPRILLLQQPPLGHEVLVQLLVLLHPFDILGAGGEGGLERAFLHVLLPLGRLADLLEEGLVPLQRLLWHVRSAEEPAQHQVMDVDSQRFLDGWDVLPLGNGDASRVEHGQRPHPPGLPVAHALDGIVDGRVHVLADEVDAHLPAPLEGNVDELDPQGLLLLNRQDLVLLRRPRAAHLEVSWFGLHRVNVLPGRLVRGLRVHPENELVQRHPGDWREVPPVERDARVQGGREEVREGDHECIGVALLALDVEEALGSRAAGLVHDDDRLRRELVLFRDPGDQARHLVGAAAGSGGHDDLDGLGGLPGCQCRAGVPRDQDQASDQPGEASPVTVHDIPSSCSVAPDGLRTRTYGLISPTNGERHEDSGPGTQKGPSPAATRHEAWPREPRAMATTSPKIPGGTGSRPGSPTSPTSRPPSSGSTPGPLP